MISAVGSIAGKIISRGNLYSQITTTGNLTGLVAAVGNIGGNGATGTTQPARYGGLSITGTVSGQVITLGNLVGDVTVTNLVGGRFAVKGSINDLFTVSSTFDANSAVVAGGSIGNAATSTSPALGLSVGSPSGIIAATGAINFLKSTSLTALRSSKT